MYWICHSRKSIFSHDKFLLFYWIRSLLLSLCNIGTSVSNQPINDKISCLSQKQGSIMLHVVSPSVWGSWKFWNFLKIGYNDSYVISNNSYKNIFLIHTYPFGFLEYQSSPMKYLVFYSALPSGLHAWIKCQLISVYYGTAIIPVWRNIFTIRNDCKPTQVLRRKYST